MKISKVVIPVAGWGTRSLPASKNIPKEMLPVFNKPVIQYVVEEALRAGLKDVVFVTSKEKRVIEDHFDYNLQLEDTLERSGKLDLLDQVRTVSEMINIISVRQKQQLGLGHAVLCAKQVCCNEPFGVILGDDMIIGQDAGIVQLIEAAQKYGLPAVGVMEVPPDKVSRYGIVSGNEIAPGILRIEKMVEKPKKEEAPSNLAIVGRYVLTPDIFWHIENSERGHGGEIQLTDALQKLASDGGMLAVKIKGLRFDAGDWAEYLTANIYFALQDETLRDDLLEQLRPLVR
ncbi:MAG: UTP--glucose-1-phosphate uridylyltransferase GalU [Desulfovibrionaceae bacterium]|nr:UTP--glucose-1-phosphate uridylyltransferase GalU [Desulfovibrionaceae bacterium]